jgi:hypothetical protein
VEKPDGEMPGVDCLGCAGFGKDKFTGDFKFVGYEVNHG